MTIEECFCDKLGDLSRPGKDWICICNQNCYVPRPCAVCGPNGCANGVGRKEAQGIIAGSIGETLAKAGRPDLEVDPETLMDPRHYGKPGGGGMRTRKKS